MRYLLLFFLILSSVTQAQLTQKQLDDLKENSKRLDSITAKTNESINNSIRRMDSLTRAQSQKQMDRNLEAFMAVQKENQRKAKQGAFIRIGIGILLLVVLIIGLRRKKKQQDIS
ncbi:hypothetical protein ACQ33O_08530 [Ferruginibacter sp. SUN002]|uniref:hypothetical protein n=1 Tax=Ferruginibacter sp. SUN002 TaxID=2937789 RepID=UPI003D361041